MNSPDVLDAIFRLWALQDVNGSRNVRLNFLTTSPIAKERVKPLIGTRAGLEEWRRAADGAPVIVIRDALNKRVSDPGLARFIADSSDEALRDRLLRPLTWSCGLGGIGEVEAKNRSALVELGHKLASTPDVSARAADVLLSRILSAIVAQGGERRLSRGDLL